jgi:hypothetical protein
MSIDMRIRAILYEELTMRKSLAALMLFSFSAAYAVAGSGSIGTVSARGDLRIDGYTVQGNGTLFDGSAIETGKATATLRLENGTEITMDSNSSGIVHRDRLDLLKGKSQLKAAKSPFYFEADGLRVSPGSTNAQGVVAIDSQRAVEVASISGDLKIVNEAGLALAHVTPGSSMSLLQQASQHESQPAPIPASANGTTVTEVGVVTFDEGHFYLYAVDGTKYQLEGRDFQKLDGQKIEVTGTLKLSTKPNGIPIIYVNTNKVNGAVGIFSTSAGKIWFYSLLAGGGAGAGIAIYETTKGTASP